jgi:hypothetical protein
METRASSGEVHESEQQDQDDHVVPGSDSVAPIDTR